MPRKIATTANATVTKQVKTVQKSINTLKGGKAPAKTSVGSKLADQSSESDTPSLRMANIGKRRATDAKTRVKDDSESDTPSLLMATIGKRRVPAKAPAKPEASTKRKTVDESGGSDESDESSDSESSDPPPPPAKKTKTAPTSRTTKKSSTKAGESNISKKGKGATTAKSSNKTSANGKPGDGQSESSELSEAPGSKPVPAPTGKKGKQTTTATKGPAKTSAKGKPAGGTPQSSELSEPAEHEPDSGDAPVSKKGKQTTTTATTTRNAPAKTSAKRKAADISAESDDSSEAPPSPPTKKAKKATTAARDPVKKTTKTKATDTATKKKPTSGRPTIKKTTAKTKATDKVAAPAQGTIAAQAPAPPPPAKKPRKKSSVISQAPKTRLHVYVFGEGTNGELGLGTAKNAVNVKRPRLNPLLSAETVGVVHVATGGMHAAALTHDNKILTWGVNDQGALGRDTAWKGRMKDADKDDDSSDSKQSDSGLNPKEATPTAIRSDVFPEGIIFTSLACGDSCTFAVTDDGSVYGWGTFRSNDGILGFTEKIHVQRTPMLIPELKAIRHIVAGTNHVLALTASGNVLAWGSGKQGQLGRRLTERNPKGTLKPHEVVLPRNKIVLVGCGDYHSFAVDKDDKTWAWGLNSFRETGHPTDAGEDSGVVLRPTVVESLAGIKLNEIAGGGHHSIAVTEDGDALVWGRMNGSQTGIKMDTLPASSLINDERGKPAILSVPTRIPGLKAIHVAAGTDNSFLITEEGKAYSWGFNANYQCGQGTTDDIEVATLIDNTAVRGKKLNWAGAGGQFSILTSPADVD